MVQILTLVLCAELHVQVSLSKILNPKLLLMCSWNLAWWPLPSVRALRWAGDLSREYPALAQRQLGLDPAKTPVTPQKGQSRYRQWMNGHWGLRSLPPVFNLERSKEVNILTGLLQTLYVSLCFCACGLVRLTKRPVLPLSTHQNYPVFMPQVATELLIHNSQT